MKNTFLFASLLSLMSFPSFAGYTISWKSNGSEVKADIQKQAQYTRGITDNSELKVVLPTGEKVSLNGKIFIESSDLVALNQFKQEHQLTLTPHRIISNAFIVSVPVSELPKKLALLSQQTFIPTAEPRYQRSLTKK